MVIVAGLTAVFATGCHHQLSFETLVRHRAAIDGFVATHCLIAVAAFVAIYIAAAALAMPGAIFLTVCAGVLFGSILGGVAAVLGATTGATLLFLIARTACGEALIEHAGPCAAKIAKGFRANAFSYLILLRLIPLFPFWLVNLVPAFVGVSLRTFIGATALGMIPGTVAYALIGAGLDGVIRTEGAAFRACLADGRDDCRIHFDVFSALTPQVVIPLAVVAVLAALPILLRNWRPRLVSS
jgi:uncharacterized membrane protein YdjX (TVP38/TMEM64 family)